MRLRALQARVIEQEVGEMKRDLHVLAAAGSRALALAATDAASAQKAGGILKLGHFDSPASMSMLEESTQAGSRPMSGVFNNLVMFKRDVPQNSLRSAAPDLATNAGHGSSCAVCTLSRDFRGS
jgi:hypothetical protein